MAAAIDAEDEGLVRGEEEFDPRALVDLAGDVVSGAQGEPDFLPGFGAEVGGTKGGGRSREKTPGALATTASPSAPQTRRAPLILSNLPTGAGYRRAVRLTPERGCPVIVSLAACTL